MGRPKKRYMSALVATWGVLALLEMRNLGLHASLGVRTKDEALGDPMTEQRELLTPPEIDRPMPPIVLNGSSWDGLRVEGEEVLRMLEKKTQELMSSKVYRSHTGEHSPCVTVTVGSNFVQNTLNYGPGGFPYQKTVDVSSPSAVCPTYVNYTQGADTDNFQVIQYGSRVQVYRTDGVGWSAEVKFECCDRKMADGQRIMESSASVRPINTRFHAVRKPFASWNSWETVSMLENVRESTTSIPSIIWQTSKTGDVPLKDKELANTWLFHNPEYELRFMTDHDMEEFFATHLPGPIHDAFTAMPLGVMRAKLWRLAVIYIHGGVYGDMDTMSIRPIRDWTEPGCRAIIGLENSEHFCYWTFAAEKQHPLIKIALDMAAAMVDASGPALFTNAISSLAGMGNPNTTSTVVDVFRTSENLFAQHGVCLRKQSFFGGDNVRKMKTLNK